MTYRQYSKASLNQAVRIAEEMKKEKEKQAPVQAELPLDPKEDVLRQVSFWQGGVDIDKAHTQAPTPAPVAPDVQAEMLSVLRSIDEKLGQLLLAWK
jgi:hypothetical protein